MASKTSASAAASFFHVGNKTIAHQKTGTNKTVVIGGEDSPYTLPHTEDPVISAFYAQLTEKERIAHAIAVEKLGTSYDVSRTHGFLKWERKRQEKNAAQ